MCKWTFVDLQLLWYKSLMGSFLKSLQGQNLTKQATLEESSEKKQKGGNNMRTYKMNRKDLSLTKKSRRGYCSVATSHHDADARLNKRHGEVDDFRALLVDGERADGHVSTPVHNLRGDGDEDEDDAKAGL